MQAQTITTHGDAAARSGWSAVFALSLCAFALIASEFMPVSLLTPLAASLNVSEGQAGQAITVSGICAVLTSLFITSIAGRLGRKAVLLALTAVMITSATIAAIAQNYVVFMIARAFVGVAVGGFWSMSAAVAMRLVPDDQVAKALAVVNGGNALATVVAAPLGSFLGSIVGWRGAFFAIVPIAVAVFIWQAVSLPSMKAETRPSTGNAFRLLVRPTVALGMAAACLFFMGQFALFTYVRPFLETAGADVSVLSLILLMMGIAGLTGSTLIGFFLKTGVYWALIAVPLMMASLALALIASGDHLFVASMLLVFWGLLATSAPVAWWMWLARTLPRDAEAGGGLMVAVIQVAIAFGATTGGLLFDLGGHQATFGVAAAVLAMSAVAAAVTWRASRREAGIS